MLHYRYHGNSSRALFKASDPIFTGQENFDGGDASPRISLAQGFLRRRGGIRKKVEGEIKVDSEPYVRATSPSRASRLEGSAVIIPEDGYLGRQARRATLISLRETIRDRSRYCKIHISRNEDSAGTSRLRECRKFCTALRRGLCVSGIRDSDGILLSILAAPLLPNRERIFRAFMYLPEKICTFRPESSSTLVYARARALLFSAARHAGNE